MILFFFFDIYEGIKKINEYVKDLSMSEFLEDQKTIDACLRNFEIIGEAANNITDQNKKNILRLIGKE